MSSPPLTGSAVFSASLRLVRANALLLVGLPFVINLGLYALSSLLQYIMGSAQSWLDFLLPPLVSGLVTLIAADLLADRRPEVKQAWSRVMSRFGPLVILSFAVTIGSLIGLALLIIPGLYIGAVMLPLVAVIVFEDTGWGSIARAFDLSKPVAWILVGLVLRLSLLGLVLIGPLIWIMSYLLINDAAAPLILMNGLIVFASSTVGAIVSVSGLLVYQTLVGRDVSDVFR